MEQVRQAFAEVVRPGNGELDGTLAMASLLVSRAVDAQVEVDVELSRLEQYASSLTGETAAEIALELFGGAAHDPAIHFSGNAGDYYDVENSLLNRVLDRRIGIPISLSVLLIEVARHRKIALHGVGMPGHFLVGAPEGYIDPFHGGRLLDAAGCEAVFQQIAGRPIALPEGSLDPTPPALIVRRILQNLVGIATNQGERRLLRACWALISAFPDASHRAHLQHAFAAAGIGQFGEAANAGERAMASLPEKAHERVQSQIDSWRARLN